MSQAMQFDTDRWLAHRAVLPPAAPWNAEFIRDEVCNFMWSKGVTTPLDVLEGKTCEAVFHEQYRAKRASDRKKLWYQDAFIEVDSFRNYTQLLRDSETMVDVLFIRMAAIYYECQFIIFDPAMEVMFVTPANAYRRLFFHIEESMFSWSHVTAEPCNIFECELQAVIKSIEIYMPSVLQVDFAPQFSDERPYVSITARLHDGSISHIKINKDCTVGHLYAEVAKSCPGSKFTLATGPLNTPLLEYNESLEALGLTEVGTSVRQTEVQFPSLRLSLVEPSFDISHERFAIIQKFHNGFTGHSGPEATMYALKQAGHEWRYMRAQVTQFIARCRTCMLTRSRHVPAGTLFSTLRNTDRPFARWHADMTGSYSQCKSTGFVFIILFVDEVTGTVMLFGSRARCALEVAISLVSLCGFFGPMEAFHSDGGSEFDAQVVHQFADIISMKHTKSVPYNPNTNGISERNIRTCKRIFRQLILDIGKYNHWGLSLPIVQWAINSTYRPDLGCTPNEFLFPSSAHRSAALIPVGIVAPERMNGSVFADINAYGVAANYIHTAKCFQESILSRLSELRNSDFRAAAAVSAVAPELLIPGTLVLIPWNWHGAPDPSLPIMRGPYIIAEKDPSSNVMLLRHTQFPTPTDQPAQLTWSSHAHVFPVDLPDRSPSDPSAVTSVPFSTSHPIDFILEHRHPARWPNGAANTNPHNVINHEYHVQFVGIPKTNAAYRQWLPHDHVRHTIAFDNYVVTNPELEGHIAISNMPANWDPHAPTQYPAHPPVAIDEYGVRFHEEDLPV